MSNRPEVFMDAGIAAQIEQVSKQIADVEMQISDAEKQGTSNDIQEKTYWRAKEMALRKTKEDLRQKEAFLRKKGMDRREELRKKEEDRREELRKKEEALLRSEKIGDQIKSEQKFVLTTATINF